MHMNFLPFSNALPTLPWHRPPEKYFLMIGKDRMFSPSFLRTSRKSFFMTSPISSNYPVTSFFLSLQIFLSFPLLYLFCMVFSAIAFIYFLTTIKNVSRGNVVFFCYTSERTEAYSMAHKTAAFCTANPWTTMKSSNRPGNSVGQPDAGEFRATR